MAKVIIIGGGPAGCEAAHQLANQGIDVELVEKNNETGGNLNNWYQLFPDRKSAKDLNDILKQNLNHPKIRLHLGMEPRKIEKNKEGKFLVPLSDGSLLEGDSLLVSTGFKIFDARRKEEYGYGIYENVITSVELENMFYNHSIRMVVEHVFQFHGKHVLQPFNQDGKREYPQTYRDHPLRGLP